MVKTWAHDELAADLAGHLKAPGRMCWTDMQLGPAGSPRPDVYTIDKSFAAPFPTAYECKISVSDFRSDVTSGKWSTYTRYAYRVFFAAPAGLITKSEVPDQCGLILRHENAWRLAKRAVVNPITIPQAALLKMLIDGVAREGPPARAAAWHGNVDVFSKKFGSTAARYVADATQIHRELENAKEQRLDIHEKARREAESIRNRALQEMPSRWVELLEVLGLPLESDRFKVQDAISKLRHDSQGGTEAFELRRILGLLRRIVDDGNRAVEARDQAKSKPEFIDDTEADHGLAWRKSATK